METAERQRQQVSTDGQWHALRRRLNCWNIYGLQDKKVIHLKSQTEKKRGGGGRGEAMFLLLHCTVETAPPASHTVHVCHLTLFIF